MFDSSLSLRLGLCSWVLPSLCRVFGESCGSGSVESLQSLRRSLWLGFRRFFAELTRRSVRVIRNSFSRTRRRWRRRGRCLHSFGVAGIFWHIVSSRLFWPRRAITFNVRHNKFTSTKAMGYLRSLIILSILFTGCSPWRGVVSTIQVRRDTNGNVPQDIAKKFVQYAEDENYKAAAMLFTPEGLEKREKNQSYGDGFRGFCNHFRKNDEHRFSSATRGKGDYFWLSYRAKYKSEKVGCSFHFIMIDGVWKMTS